MLRTQVDVVLSDGVAVLNAGDATVASLAPLCDGDVIFYAADAETAQGEVVQTHRAAGGRAVLLRGGRVVLATGTQEVTLADLGEHRRARGADAGPRPGLSAEVLVASAAAAWALGISPDLMAAGIETFNAEAPARP